MNGEQYVMDIIVEVENLLKRIKENKNIEGRKKEHVMTESNQSQLKERCPFNHSYIYFS